MMAAVESLLGDGLGYTEVSVEALCEQSGVSRSTFYSYFEDKGHLLRVITKDVLADLGEIAAEWWSHGNSISYDELNAIIVRLAAAYREHDLLLAALADTAVYDPGVREVYDGMMNGFITEIAGMIEADEADPKKRASGLASETAALLTWMCERTYHQLVNGADEDTVARVAAAHAEILWRSVHGR